MQAQTKRLCIALACIQGRLPAPMGRGAPNQSGVIPASGTAAERLGPNGLLPHLHLTRRMLAFGTMSSFRTWRSLLGRRRGLMRWDALKQRGTNYEQTLCLRLSDGKILSEAALKVKVRHWQLCQDREEYLSERKAHEAERQTVACRPNSGPANRLHSSVLGVSLSPFCPPSA